MFKVFVIFVCLGAFSVDAKSVVSTEFDLLEAKALNDNPIIGVLSQEISFYLNGKYPDQFNSYIAASYVKFVEGGGSRVVPVWIGKSKEYYQDIMSKLNGILLPGGGTYFNHSDGYADAGKHIYDIAIEMNNQGDYFPIWGTCLGFELLTYLSANGNEHRAHCSSLNQALPLEFQPDFQTSRMFRDAPAKVVKILTTEAVTSNFHQYCVTQKNLTDFNLDSEWRVMSVNKDWNGMEFISTIEHVNYPFYGVQFHPEKNLYEWVLNKNISHSSNAILASQYFAQFFINEARKSDHHFDNAKNEDNHVIYNFPATFTGAKGSAFEQSYMFNDVVSYNVTSKATSLKNKARKIIEEIIEF